VLLRDYGAHDEAELRFGAGQRLGTHLFFRQDGTLAQFFTAAQLRCCAAAAGLETLSCELLHRRYTNRASGQELRRVWVHAVFRAPGWDPALGPVGLPPAGAGPPEDVVVGEGEAAPAQASRTGGPPHEAAGHAALARMAEYEWLRGVCGFVGECGAGRGWS
jgi:hypothetical protein